jgi:hypothetical protein
VTLTTDDNFHRLDLYFDPFVHLHQKLSQRSMTDRLEMLTAREQLMWDIDGIVEEFACNNNISEDNMEDLIRVLCDSVCKNFPSN